MSSQSKKVLISGDVGGKWEALFKRVGAVNKSNGPFDCLFCVGGSFAPGGDGTEDIPGDLVEYIAGVKKPPVTTYFIGAFGVGSTTTVTAFKTDGECEMFPLGRSGVMTIEGLRVAFLDGTYDPSTYREPVRVGEGGGFYHESDVFQLLKMAGAGAGEVDLLLTCDWPRDVLTYSTAPPGGVDLRGGSPVVAEVAEKLKPRYHFVGGGMGSASGGVFYQREPYKPPAPARHVTRFIALGAVGNAGKHKSLHALGLVAAKDMDAASLAAVPPGTTRDPYSAPAEDRGDRASLRSGATPEEGGQQFRWTEPSAKRPRHQAAAWGDPNVKNDSAKTIYVKNVPWRCEPKDLEEFFKHCGEVEDIRRALNDDGKLKGFCHVQFTDAAAVEKAIVLSGMEMMGRELFIDAAAAGSKPRGPAPDGRPVGSCWFCLSNGEADTHLVTSVGEEMYLAVDKGAIVPMHALMLPVEHMPNTLYLSDGAFAESEKYLSALRTCFAAQGQELVCFERYLQLRKSGGNHSHVNVAPVPRARAGAVRGVFEAHAKKTGFEFEHHLPAVSGEDGRSNLRVAVGEEEFIRVVLPDGSSLVHVITKEERHPMNYGREALAEALGMPERGDWKNCKLGKAAEEQLANDFKAVFEKFDPMNE
eukprot:CAMPEP_0182878580 /NCGR_PEP_ID=MMETSP0034_2-20130328/15439_1 /TAXON_ID=156128 /ORGANISM="Nephroselmis pyriformis, Strain CCMP717" /LENGTH=642 /DNA_ID=CAMNT_0025011473 /DNA_START=1 /DNA_END=1929 /DNA_ORIENTATION=+